MDRIVRGRTQAQRGSVTVEIAVLGPALLLLVFTVVQLALWAYARNLALAAAQEGASAAAAHGASPGDGVMSAQQFLAASAGDSLNGTSIDARVVADTRVRVQVAGTSLSVLPGVAGFAVTQSAEVPRERFYPDPAP